MDLIKKLRDTGRPVMNEDGSVNLEGIDFSAADTYLRCPETYRRRYLEGKRSPPGVALLEGTSHHAAMEADNLSKRDTGKIIPARRLTEIFQEKLDEETERANEEHSLVKSTLDWEGEDRGRLLARAKILHVDWSEKWTRKFDPVAVEQSFTKDVDIDRTKFAAYGQTDLTTKDNTVWDFKTSSKAKSQSEVDNSLQLSLYSWAFGHKKVGYIALVKTVTPYIQVVSGERTPGQWVWGAKVLASVVRGIRAGSFPLVNPGGFPPPWFCSEKWCGYWRDCRGKYDVAKPPSNSK
jgi:hypothetical protein